MRENNRLNAFVKQPRGEDETAIELSLIVPAFNEEGNLSELYRRLYTVLSKLGLSWEIIFADDGSSDGTWKKILELHQQDKSVKGLRLSRNFGHQYALFAALRHAKGNAVISMDADLQHPPEIIPKLVEQWRGGHGIVNTARLDPSDYSVLKKLSSRMFYALFTLLSGVKLEHGMADFRLLDRRVVDQLLQFREEGLFLRGLVQWVGYSSVTVSFQCEERFSGVSKYNFLRMLTFGWHGISSFSIVPLRLGIILGIFTSLISFAWLGHALYARIFAGTAIPGWASTVGIISLLFGILFIFLGLLGEYIGRILVQVRDRPLYIVADGVGIIGIEEAALPASQVRHINS